MTIGKARILVIDDEPGLLRVAERVLGDRYEVLALASPLEAVARAAGFAPDMVLCDIRMPELDGFGVMRRMKAILPGIDVILMTGSHSDPDEHLLRAIREDAFYFIEKPFDRRVLEALVTRCLELRRLRVAERRHTQRMEQELQQAHAVQKAMMPGEAMSSGPIRVRAACLPSSELSGDFFDFERTGGGGIGVMIADVCGHGVSAALLTATVKSAFRAEAESGFSPRRVVDRLHSMIASFPPTQFATLFVARIEPAGVCEYVNAGHPPAWKWGGDLGIERLESTGPLVSGAFPPGSWEEGRTRLAGGGLLVMSDGFADLLGPGGRLGMAGADAIARQAIGKGGAIIESMLDGAAAHRGPVARLEDDVTLLEATVAAPKKVS